MAKLRVFIGWDPRDDTAYHVCRKSLLEHASIDLEIIPLRDWRLRQEGIYHRRYVMEENGQMVDLRDDQPFSTQFSYTRFLVPFLSGFSDEWVLFCDPDTLWRGDVAQLLALADDGKSVMVVKHNHKPKEDRKMDGVVQMRYARKNWSSVVLWKPSANRFLTPYQVNTGNKGWLHSFGWLLDDQIGELPLEWNWLEGYSDPGVDPKVAHYTRGTPDFPGYERARFASEWRRYV